MREKFQAIVKLAALAQEWPLECDGTTRCIASVLIRNGVDFKVVRGQLTVADVGYISPHWWIAFPDGHILDVKARMWLDVANNKVPHGVFKPEPDVVYVELQEERNATWAVSNMLFELLTLTSIQSYDQLFS